MPSILMFGSVLVGVQFAWAKIKQHCSQVLLPVFQETTINVMQAKITCMCQASSCHGTRNTHDTRRVTVLWPRSNSTMC